MELQLILSENQEILKIVILYVRQFVAKHLVLIGGLILYLSGEIAFGLPPIELPIYRLAGFSLIDLQSFKLNNTKNICFRVQC